MKYFKLFENFISEPLNEAMSFDDIKDKYIENPYGIGAQIIELIDSPAGRRMLVFKHDNKYDRDKIEANLKSIGIPAKKLSTSKADKAYKYPYEVTLHESEAFDINEGKTVSEKSSGIMVDGKPVNYDSIELEDVKNWDRPDFADAYASYAEFENGKELTDKQLEELTDEHPDVINQIANEQ